MVEVVGDTVMPRELIIKDATGENLSGALTISGALLFLSGGKLNFIDGATVEQITST